MSESGRTDLKALFIMADALEEIKRDQGKVCEDFETCDHVSCRSSVASYFIAEKAIDDVNALYEGS